MKSVSSFFVLFIIASTAYAQSNTFSLADSVFAKNTIYTCPKSDFSNGYERSFNSTKIDSVKLFLRSNDCIKIQIGCHSDQRGSAPYNQVLTKRYAENLKYTICDSTISLDRISTIGFGESEPLIDSTIIDNYAADTERDNAYKTNRRIEIVITDL